MDPAEVYGGYGPMRNYGRLYGSLDFDDVSALVYHSVIACILINQWIHNSNLALLFLMQYGYGASGSSRSRMDWRYRPY